MPSERTVVGLAVVVGVLLFAWMAYPSLDTVVDDAYISARYAEHASQGYGLVYNAGEPPVEGYTNLAFTVLLALGRLVGLPMHGLLVGLGFGFGVLSIVAMAAFSASLLEPGHRYLAAMPTLLLALDPHLAVVSTNGLEGSMFLASVLGALAAVFAVQGSARWLVGLGLGLLGTVRPEGLLVAAGCLAFDAWNHRKQPRNPLSYALVVGVVGVQVPVMTWRLATYGAWVPNTASAKVAHSVSKLLAFHRQYLAPDQTYWIAVGLGLISLPWLSRFTLRKALSVCIAYGLIAVASTVYLWMPGGPKLLPSVAIGLALAVLPLQGALRQTPRVTQALRLAFGALLVGWGGYLVVGPVDATMRRLDRRHSVLPNNGAMRAGLHLRAHVPPGAWLASRDAGVLAYAVGTGIKVLELHPRALTQPHPGGTAFRAQQALTHDPELLALTVNTRNHRGGYYRAERKLWKSLTSPYVYLGRVYQHRRRHYDLFARQDLGVPALPSAMMVNRAGEYPGALTP